MGKNRAAVMVRELTTLVELAEGPASSLGFAACGFEGRHW